MTKEARLALAQTRFRILEAYPYLARGLYYMRPSFRDDLPTASVALSGDLRINRGFFLRCSSADQEFVVLHEINHLLRHSHERMHGLLECCKQRGTAFNIMAERIATDLPINQDLANLGYTASIDTIGAMMPAKFELPGGQSYEEYYWLLAERATEQDAAQGCTHEDGTDDFDEGALEDMQQSVAAEVRAAEKAKAGSVPGGLLRWAESQLTEPVISWQRLLYSAVRDCLKMTGRGPLRTWSKIARKQAGVGMSPTSPRIAATARPKLNVEVWVDTSGSMSAEMIKAGMAEVQGILKSVRATVLVGSIDTEIQSVQATRSVRDVVLRGGGGTVFTELFNRIARTKPDIVIMFTDGEASGVPDTQPSCKWLWLLPLGAKAPVSWGRSVELPS